MNTFVTKNYVGCYAKKNLTILFLPMSRIKKNPQVSPIVQTIPLSSSLDGANSLFQSSCPKTKTLAAIRSHGSTHQMLGSTGGKRTGT